MSDDCWTLDANGRRVTAHSHYHNVCHAYPGPNGVVVVDGHVFSVSPERHMRGGYVRGRLDPETFPKPPCPTCGAPCEVTWADVSTFGSVERAWLPAGLECPVSKFHDVASAYQELSWPAGLTDDDRMWLRSVTA